MPLPDGGRRRAVRALLLVGGAATCGALATPVAAQDPRVSEAQRVAREWLEKSDAGDAKATYAAASAKFRGAMTPEQWAKLTRETLWGFLKDGVSAAPIDVNLLFTHLGPDGKPANWTGSHWTGHHEWAKYRGSALAQHPAVAQCAVIGIPSERWGEQVHAVVVLKGGASATPDELVEFSKTLIAGYKCPRSVDITSTPLPLSGAGKILKRELRLPFWENQTRRVS